MTVSLAARLAGHSTEKKAIADLLKEIEEIEFGPAVKRRTGRDC